jgi:hypothetical protein
LGRFGCFGADGDDHAGRITAEEQRVLVRDHLGRHPGREHVVERVEPGSADADEHRAIAYLRERHLLDETYAPIVGAPGRLLAAAEDARVVRPGLDLDDVILALAGLWEIEPATD